MRYASSNDPHRRQIARRIVPLLLSLSLLATPVAAAPHPHPRADASVIATWNEMALTTVNGGTASPTNFNYYAFMHLAMYNAVAAITGEYELYKWERRGAEAGVARGCRSGCGVPDSDQLLPRPNT